MLVVGELDGSFVGEVVGRFAVFIHGLRDEKKEGAIEVSIEGSDVGTPVGGLIGERVGDGVGTGGAVEDAFIGICAGIDEIGKDVGVLDGLNVGDEVGRAVVGDNEGNGVGYVLDGDARSCIEGLDGAGNCVGDDVGIHVLVEGLPEGICVGNDVVGGSVGILQLPTLSSSYKLKGELIIGARTQKPEIFKAPPAAQ